MAPSITQNVEVIVVAFLKIPAIFKLMELVISPMSRRAPHTRRLTTNQPDCQRPIQTPSSCWRLHSALDCVRCVAPGRYWRCWPIIRRPLPSVVSCRWLWWQRHSDQAAGPAKRGVGSSLRAVSLDFGVLLHCSTSLTRTSTSVNRFFQ